MTPAQTAILNYIAGPESGGQYNIIFGGHHFDSYADHPRIPVPLRGKPGWHSTAAGRYQMLSGTWDEAARAIGAKDFSPENQDRAAWWLASTTYKKHTGRDLDADWTKGQVDWKALAPHWTSVVHEKPEPAASVPPPQPLPPLTNPPELQALLAPGAPLKPLGRSNTTPALNPAPLGPSPSLALLSAMPQLQLAPIDYDPWKLAPHLEPIHHDPFNPPGGAGEEGTAQ